ncbi:MAG: hypothetical protein C0597_10570 [Marinilabiliales bacterium]|nr:MAG: hypothetical protein C0597_10570 [Marinilabiliales bacterium]
MKKYIIISLLLCVNYLFAQETEEKKIKIEPSGFIKSDVFFDTRQNVEVLEDLLLIFPKDIELDENGKDINDHGSLGIVDISTRIRGKVTGPDLFGAKLTGLIEVDWTGITGSYYTSRVRLRHAYSKLNWDKTEVLLGREWHPMFVKECYPSVMSLNTGIPFQPFNRSPMLQVSHEFGMFKVIGAAISQSDYVSSGPDGKSAQYIKNANIPNLHLQLQFKPENFVFGLAVDYKSIMPRLKTESLVNVDPNYDSLFVTNEKVNSISYMAYLKYKKSKLEIKAKAIYGQNLSESVMPGGYGVTSIDSITGREKYAPYNHFYTWANIIYGDQTKFALFGGYTKNLGAVDPIVGDTYGMALNVDYFYRIAPTVSHKIKNFMFAVELEYTVAAYGDVANVYGEFTKSHEVSNTRIMFSLFHFF